MYHWIEARCQYLGVVVAVIVTMALPVPCAAAGDRKEALSAWWVAFGGGSGEVEVIGHDRAGQVADALAEQGWTVLRSAGSEDDATRVYNLRGGYRFNPYLGVELAYWDLGETEGDFYAEVLRDDELMAVRGSIESRYQTWALALMATWPVHRRIGLSAKLGGHRWQHQFEIRSASTRGVDGRENDSGYSWLWALGVEIMATRWLGFDFYWQRFGGIEGEDGIDAKALGVIFRF